MKLKIIMILFLCFLTTGCWNYRELNDLSISTGMSIDKDGDEYEVGMLISNAQKAEGSAKEGESQTIVLSGKGKTILEAIKEIEQTSPKEIYFRHLLVLVVSEDIAKDGMMKILDYLFREPQSRKMFYMILSKDSKAKDTLKILSPLESFPSQTIATNIKETSELQAFTVDTTYNSFLSDLLEPGKNPYVSSVSIDGSVKKGEKEDNLTQTEPDTSIKLGTVGIFKGDKLIGWTTKEENEGINILNNKIDKMYIVFDYQNSPISISFSNMNTKTNVKLKNNVPIIEVTVSGDGTISEINQDVHLRDPKTIEDIESASKKQLKKYTDKALTLTQKKYKSDVFGYGNLIYKNYPKIWEQIKENWDEEKFTKLEVNVTYDITLKTKGSLKQSIEEVENGSK